ncbi:nucleotide-binding alpha-beta plait domain-containing protein [Tanacetum coccineum]|uniref:Nucleotide-binding alpha-beta plait domain-containing protein n=1 Tax=Tanacetum coccineum TaxID=301880 RepID=A0ABQ5HPZ7_9ASTR
MKYNKSSTRITKGEGTEEGKQRSPLFNTRSKHEGIYKVNQEEGKGDEKGIPNPSHNVINFFFTNFPPDWNKTDLHGLFAEVGEIADLYVARKVSKAEFKNKEGDSSPRVDDVRCVEEGVKIDIESNNIIKSGSNSICGEINDLIGMDMKCINAHKVVITKDFTEEDESTKADEDVTSSFPAQVKEGENSKFEFDLKYKHEEARDSCIGLSNARENDLSSYFVDDNRKEKESKLCDTTKEKDGSLCCDEDNIRFKPKSSKLDLERIILYSRGLRPNMSTKEIREGFASFNPPQTSSIQKSHPTSLKGSIHRLRRKKDSFEERKNKVF